MSNFSSAVFRDNRTSELCLVTADAVSIRTLHNANLVFKEGGDETALRMQCGGVPKEEDSPREDRTRFYSQAIKQVLGQ